MIAIAIRALELNAWRRDARTRAAGPTAATAPVAEPNSVASNTDSGDYRLFMRPPAEKSD